MSRPPGFQAKDPGASGSSLSEDFAFPPGGSYLERIFSYNPILSCLMSYLDQDSLLALYLSCTAARNYLPMNPRYFRHLILVRKGKQKFVEVQDFRFAETPNYGKSIYGHQGSAAAISNYNPYRFKPHPLAQPLWFDHHKRLTVNEKYVQAGPVYYEKLMGRHLYWNVKNMVARLGTNLTTLVIDGTMIETYMMQEVLRSIEGTLRGLSVHSCPYLDCNMWGEWIMEALAGKRKFALQWLRSPILTRSRIEQIYNSGNVPRSAFLVDEHPEMLMPVPSHAEDIPPKPFQWNGFRRGIFANLVPRQVLEDITIPLLAPLFLTPSHRRHYITCLKRILGMQRASCKMQQKLLPGQQTWMNIPDWPLGEPHPIIILMTLAQWRGIQLDISLCSARPYCKAITPFLVRPGRNQLMVPPADFFHRIEQMNISGNHWSPDVELQEVPELCRLAIIAEVGGRRSREGCQPCFNCGLFEDEISPREHRLVLDEDGNRVEGSVAECGGVKWGPGVGKGRGSIGAICKACEKATVCVGCKSFFCTMCLIPVTPDNPNSNPLALQTPSDTFLQCICSHHGPHCQECVEFDNINNIIVPSFHYCFDCRAKKCLLCYPRSYGFQSIWSTYSANGPNSRGSSFGRHYRNRDTFAGNLRGWCDQDYPRIRIEPGNGRHHIEYPAYQITDTRLWETCDWCRTEVCAHCIGYDENNVIDPCKRASEEFRGCVGGCGRRACVSCQNSRIQFSHCVDCGEWRCRECIFGEEGNPWAREEEWDREMDTPVVDQVDWEMERKIDHDRPGWNAWYQALSSEVILYPCTPPQPCPDGTSLSFVEVPRTLYTRATDSDHYILSDNSPPLPPSNRNLKMYNVSAAITKENLRLPLRRSFAESRPAVVRDMATSPLPPDEIVIEGDFGNGGEVDEEEEEEEEEEERDDISSFKAKDEHSYSYFDPEFQSSNVSNNYSV
ncbi:hypothetical protein RUND412_000243 [Rhizina undulata]